jgi:hypothetical protein
MDFYNSHKVSRWSKCHFEPLVCSFEHPVTLLTAIYDRELANSYCTAMLGIGFHSCSTPLRPVRTRTDVRIVLLDGLLHGIYGLISA